MPAAAIALDAVTVEVTETGLPLCGALGEYTSESMLNALLALVVLLSVLAPPHAPKLMTKAHASKPRR